MCVAKYDIHEHIINFVATAALLVPSPFKGLKESPPPRNYVI